MCALKEGRYPLSAGIASTSLTWLQSKISIEKEILASKNLFINEEKNIMSLWGLIKWKVWIPDGDNIPRFSELIGDLKGVNSRWFAKTNSLSTSIRRTLQEAG